MHDTGIFHYTQSKGLRTPQANANELTIVNVNLKYISSPISVIVHKLAFLVAAFKFYFGGGGGGLC